jgi:hypothetical protein
VPVPPILGRSTELTLEDGSRLRGELIAATGTGLMLGQPDGHQTTELERVQRVRIRRHDFSGRKVLAWVGIGALASGLGMGIACSQVEDNPCGDVAVGVAASFGLIGGLFGAGIAGSGWQELPVDAEVLRAYARFPQGPPPGFGR